MRALLAVVFSLVASPAFATEEPGTSFLPEIGLARFDLAPPSTSHLELQLLPLARLDPGLVPAQAWQGDRGGRRVTWLHEEARVYWYTAGAGAITSLGTRVLLALPLYLGLVLGGTVGVVLGPAPLTAIILALAAAYTLVDSTTSSLMMTFMFNHMSRYYEGSMVSGLAGHLAGNLLAASATWLIFGFGLMQIFGLHSLVPFAPLPLQLLVVFSALGFIPSLVVAFIASLTIPALVGAWALASTAQAKPGYVIDPTLRGTAEDRALPADRHAPIGFAVLLPGT